MKWKAYRSCRNVRYIWESGFESYIPIGLIGNLKSDLSQVFVNDLHCELWCIETHSAHLITSLYFYFDLCIFWYVNSFQWKCFLLCDCFYFCINLFSSRSCNDPSVLYSDWKCIDSWCFHRICQSYNNRIFANVWLSVRCDHQSIIFKYGKRRKVREWSPNW